MIWLAAMAAWRKCLKVNSKVKWMMQICIIRFCARWAGSYERWRCAFGAVPGDLRELQR
jgi:hypothetical protein